MNLLIRKWGQYVSIPEEMEVVFEEILSPSHRTHNQFEEIARDGGDDNVTRLILNGWVGRSRQVSDARRAIFGLALPGDFCGLSGLLLPTIDHSLVALTAVTLVEIAPVRLSAAVLEHSWLREVLWGEWRAQESIQRQWLLSLGQLTAVARMARLFCELYIRLGCVGLTHGPTFELPIRQSELADILGFTVIHANRILRELRSRNLVQLDGRTLTISRFEDLARIGHFDPHSVRAAPLSGKPLFQNPAPTAQSSAWRCRRTPTSP
ncbi:Crp/Fnr family transcriptional regulator [Methylobacterium sp. JK268]